MDRGLSVQKQVRRTKLSPTFAIYQTNGFNSPQIGSYKSKSNSPSPPFLSLSTPAMITSVLRVSLTRCSRSVLRISAIQRPDHHLRDYSTSPLAAATATPVSGPPAAAAAGTNSDRDIGKFLKAVAGIVASGSALGLWLLASSDPPLLFGSGQLHDPKEDLSPVEEKKQRFLFGDAYRKKVFFNYEKRIRLRSPPEKVFEYFASHRTPTGQVLMTPADLMRAIVPVFPPSDSNLVREGSLRGERHPGELCCSPSKFFMLFDTNNDGLISFPEYIFFVTLLSIPESSFSVAFKMFDLDNNGQIEREEFKKVMALMRTYNRQGASHKNGLRIGLRAGKSVENGGLVEYFFGKDGTGSLQHERFVEFLRDLHEEIISLEFAHYDCKSRGKISAKDFALSMIASAEITHINKYIDRVDELDTDPHLRDMCISLEEFKTFAELRTKLQPLALAIFSYGKINGLLTKQDFQRAASHVCGISLSHNVVDVIFHVFDANRDGSLSSEEFLSALQRREGDIRQPKTTGIMGPISCWLNCAKSWSFTQISP